MSLPHRHILLARGVVRASVSEPETRSAQERAMGFLHMKNRNLLHAAPGSEKKKVVHGKQGAKVTT